MSQLMADTPSPAMKPLLAQIKRLWDAHRALDAIAGIRPKPDAISADKVISDEIHSTEQAILATEPKPVADALAGAILVEAGLPDDRDGGRSFRSERIGLGGVIALLEQIASTRGGTLDGLDAYCLAETAKR